MSLSRPRRASCLVRLLAGGLLAVVLPAALLALNNLRLPTRSSSVALLGTADKLRLAEATHLRSTLGNEIWPGFGDADIPAINYNEEYAFLVGLADPTDGWIKVPAGVTRGGPWQVAPGDTFNGQPYYRQRLVGGVTPENFCVRVGDRWAYGVQTIDGLKLEAIQQMRQSMPALLRPFFPYGWMVGSLIDSSDKYVSLHVHEAFHAFQGLTAPGRLALAEQTAARRKGEYPWSDQALQAAWRAELESLAQALRTTGEQETRTETRVFLQAREERRRAAGLGATLTDYERQREWLEGLARYVELESWRLAATGGYEPLPETSQLADFHRYEGWTRRWAQELEQMPRMASDVGDGRFYYSGMAQAFLLDRLLPGWKEQALGEGVWLEELLAQAVSD